MVRTRGGSRYRPRVRFSILGMEDPDTSGIPPADYPDLPGVEQPAEAPTAVPEEPQGFRRYQTKIGPRAPSPVPERRRRRARPSNRARTSGPGESSSSQPQLSPSSAEESSSPQLSQASRIRRPLFLRDPDFEERRAPRQGLPQRVVLRCANIDR